MRVRIVLFGALILLGGCRTVPSPSDTTALTLSPDEQNTAAALAHFALGSFYEQDRGANAPEAIREFELASEYDPGRHRIHSKIAVGYLMRRQPSRAIAVLESSCLSNPDQLEPLVDLAVTYQLAGKLDEALDCIEKAIALAPDQSELYTTAAKIHMHRTNDAATIDVLRRGLRVAYDTELVELATMCGRQLIGQQELNRALPYFLLLRDEERHEATPALLNLIGQIYLETKQTELAAASLYAASQFPQPPPETFTKLGATQMFLGREIEAVAALEKGHAMYPNNTRLLFSLALAYNSVERADDACRTLYSIKAQADTDPTKKLSMEFYITYGATADHTGRTLEAEAAFETCLELYPDAHQALNYLAYLWAESDQNIDKAMEHVTRAITIQPNNPAYIDTLAWVHYRKGDYAAARDELMKALALLPDDATINEHMGDVYDALDAQEKARHYWTQSLMQDPGNQAVAWKLEATGTDVAPILRRARKTQRRKKKEQN